MSVQKYAYQISTLQDVADDAQVFVPNASSRETLEIWRYLLGLRPDFPEYEDGSNIVNGVTEEAWCLPQEYLEAYCPKTMTCITRVPMSAARKAAARKPRK